MIHGDIAEDRKINSVSEGAETLFFRLLAKTDDFGRYFGDPDLLRGKIYPRRPELSVHDIEGRLIELVTKRLLNFYEVDEDFFVEFRGFEKRQAFRKDVKRKARFPEPPSRWGVESSVELVTNTFGHGTDADESERDRDDSSPERIRPGPVREGKEREGKERESKESQGGGGGHRDVRQERPETPPPPPPSTSSSSSSPSLPPKDDVDEDFLVQTYLSRFPHSQVPERSARKQIARALSCKVTSQEIYEVIERTAAASTSKAEKIWTLLDPLVEAQSVTGSGPPAPASSGSGSRPPTGGLSIDVLKDIAVGATEGKGGK
jgi:hypothetical protein